MNISRSCKVPNLKWVLMPDLAARLEKQGWPLTETSVEVRRPPDTLEFDSIEEACENVRAQGPPNRYSISFIGKAKSTSKHLSLSLLRISDDGADLRMRGIPTSSEIDGLMEFPRLISIEPPTQFKPGVLADHEFIPFQDSMIETTFVPVLEGLRELGYLDFGK